MSCSLRQSLLSSSRTPADLEILRNVVLQKIRNLLFAEAKEASLSTNLQIRIATCGPPSLIFLGSETRIAELDYVDILANYHNFPSGGRALYDYTNGKIILRLGRWCWETLIHETLHSVSFPCVRKELIRRYLNFFEGLTEFFTGYVMFREYHDCYFAWKEE